MKNPPNRIKVLMPDRKIVADNYKAEWYEKTYFYTLEGKEMNKFSIGDTAYYLSRYDEITLYEVEITAVRETKKKDHTVRVEYEINNTSYYKSEDLFRSIEEACEHLRLQFIKEITARKEGRN